MVIKYLADASNISSNISSIQCIMVHFIAFHHLSTYQKILIYGNVSKVNGITPYQTVFFLLTDVGEFQK
jgi:hypothetical protein